MKLPSDYPGVFLFDDNSTKSNIKLSNDRKNLHKQIIQLIQINLGKSVSNDIENQRLISVFIILLNLDSNNNSNILLVYKYFRLFKLSIDGKLITCKGEYKNNSKSIQLIGMDNYKNTTCYLDSLIVSLFYSNSSFDFLLDNSIDPNLSDDFQIEINKLKIIMRFIVNLLRSGEHINTNIMYQLLLVLNSLGCDMVLSGKQQDSLQAFEFLAESLSLPLLTLKLDIIHNGKLNVSDDLRLIDERCLLISIPTSSSSLDLPVTLEECLNTYFNNSITVRRHIDQRMTLSHLNFLNDSNLSSNIPPPISSNESSEIPLEDSSLLLSSSPSPLSALSISNNNEEDLNSTTSNNEDEINQYEKLGILTYNTTNKLKSLESINTTTDTIPTTPQQSSSAIFNSSMITPSSGSDSFKNIPYRSNTPPIETTTNSIINFSPNITNPNISTSNSNSTPTSTPTPTPFDSLNRIGSFRTVNQKLERQRTRSSTLASVLNNVQLINPTRLTRRSSSISNTEVSLPAWMYLQLLPYYTDPEIKLTVENHEEFYRRRTSRSKTIDSIQANTNTNTNTTPKNDESINQIPNNSYFNQRFNNKRPVIPICLKRYIWNERGQPIKINRKVTIPEIIKYPYFIAEDRTKPGFVDFKRSFDHKAPRGSFMLVLQSCVCHRGNSTNSGHYVSIVRKRQYSSSITNNSNNNEWIIFNDMEIGKDKAKTYTFNEVMEKETPYILFYEIVEIKHDGYQTPIGGKDLYWNRKQSIISGISGNSEQTLQLNEESSSLFDKESITKHVMHLSLAGLNLSKSKSRNLGEFNDVLDDYYWYDDFKKSNLGSNISSISNSHFNSNSNLSREKSNDESTKINVIEINPNDSSMNNSSIGNSSINNSIKSGEIEYIEDSTNDLPIDPFNKNDNNIIKTPTKKSFGELKSIYSSKSVGTIKDNENNISPLHSPILKKDEEITNSIDGKIKHESVKKKLGRKGTVRKLFKKVFN
ncbi:hypothetical protein DAPK24_049070 [Pichia kluyveri]|uniref:ubiquitinyl hydrolase 1 n=1 Tax=Pichia kluyveri TaxID=36015 RepID=A0AAV5R9T8_PICKL|nr:hypothetical protein DAPK24_049070 [Pichia kluyveri]